MGGFLQSVSEMLCYSRLVSAGESSLCLSSPFSLLDVLWLEIIHDGRIYTADYQQVLQIKVVFLIVCILSFLESQLG